MVSPLKDIDPTTTHQRTSVKWRRFPEDVLPMWVAEMDTQLAAPIAEALHRAVDAGDTGYAHGTELAEALVGFAADRWQWHIDIAHTLVVPDVKHGIAELLKLVTRPGDAVVVNPPVYPPFFALAEHMGLRVVDAPLSREGRLDMASLEQALPGTQAYLLCSPHNPTGSVHTADELAAAAELANRHGVRVIVDEIHAPLTLAGATFTPFLTVPGSETAFALLSASKAWNLAALKAAVAIAGPQAEADLARVPEEVSHGNSHFGVIAHTAALRHGAPWLDALLSDLDDNRRLLGELLADQLPLVRYQPPEATYLTWLDCRELGLGDDPAEAFLEKGKVALVPGPTFGQGGNGHVRLNIGTSPELVREGVRRMGLAV